MKKKITVLINNQNKQFLNALRAYPTLKKLQVVIFFLALSAVLVYSLVEYALFIEQLFQNIPVIDKFREQLYRMNVLLSAIVSIVSFSSLWYTKDIRLIHLFPVDGVSLWFYALWNTFKYTIPVALSPCIFLFVLANGDNWLIFEAFLAVIFVWVGTVFSSIFWNAWAAKNIGNPKLADFNKNFGGTLVPRDRGILLYSPFLGSVTGLLIGFLSWVSLTKLANGYLFSGIIFLSISIFLFFLIIFKSFNVFKSSYYKAYMLMYETSYENIQFDTTLPYDRPSIMFINLFKLPYRSIVRKDLIQLNRKYRTQFILLYLADIFVVMTAIISDLSSFEWMPAFCWFMLLYSAGIIFRFKDNELDSDTHWLLWPVSWWQNYFSRASISLFLMLYSSPLLLGLKTETLFKNTSIDAIIAEVWCVIMLYWFSLNLSLLRSLSFSALWWIFSIAIIPFVAISSSDTDNIIWFGILGFSSFYTLVQQRKKMLV